MSQATATVSLPISDDVCRDFLTQCYDSASSYWLACDDRVKDEELNVIKIIGCHDAEDPEEKWGDADWETIRVGIQRMLLPEAQVSSELKAQVLELLVDPESSAWDDWTCDAALQFGLLGELVYG